MKSKTDLLLVTPPSRLQVYQSLSNNFSAIETPVWSGLIAKFIRDKGYSVEILDAEAMGLSHEDTAQAIIDTNALLTTYVIYGQQPSASTQCMPAGRKVAKIVSETSDLLSMVMGTHASALPKRTLMEEPYNFVCEGEGPNTVLHLLEVLKGGGKSFKKVPGLWHQENGEVFSNPPAENLQDLDSEVPSQAWDLLDMTQYRAHNWHCFDHLDQRSPYASLQTSLGCPYKCSFCCINAPFGSAGIRYWSPQNIIGQIDLLVNKYGIKNIKIPDEMFVLNQEHVMGICDLIIERKYELNIWAYARVDTVKDRYLEKLKKAGFNWLALGIESGSQFVRDGVEKGRFREQDIISTTNQIQDHGIYIIANYIFGLPDDDHKTMQETFDLSLEIKSEWANFYCAMAYPGSPLFDHAKKSNWPLPGDKGGPGWIGYSQHSYESLPLPTNFLSSEEVLDFRDNAFDKYFTSPSYLSMIGQKFGQKHTSHIQDMVSLKIKRKHRD